MRITGGFLRSRLLKVPEGPVRPTQDMVRAALFSILGARVPGCRFLDLCAGTGAVGLEAWSREAREVCWVESNRRVAGILKDNIETLCGREGAECRRVFVTDGVSFVKKGLVDPAFDIVFADPPYGKQLCDALLAALKPSPLVAADGLVVLEQARDEVLTAAGWTVTDTRAYGGSQLVFLRRE